LGFCHGLLYVGHVPGFPGAYSQGATLDELNENLREVIEMLLEDGRRCLPRSNESGTLIVLPFRAIDDLNLLCDTIFAR
jgi:predicted RNase H-like HicB family nuclease